MKVVKGGNEKPGSPAPASRSLTHFWPVQRLENELDCPFKERLGGWLIPNGPLFDTCMPVVDVYEDATHVRVKAELPGMKKEALEVYLTGRDLNIAGERKVGREEKAAEIYRAERYFGRFHRRIPLPAPVDGNNIIAHYRNGILTITCLKTETARRKHVEVKVD